MSMIGRTLGHYTVSTLIGRGSMGVVYRAKDQKLGRDVAIKVLPEPFTGIDKKHLQSGSRGVGTGGLGTKAAAFIAYRHLQYGYCQVNAFPKLTATISSACQNPRCQYVVAMEVRNSLT